jgi:hypothetical protein
MTHLNSGNINSMKLVAKTAVIFSLVMVMLLAGFSPTSAAGTPYTSIVSVNKDVSVTITGYNFPMNQTFTVRMGAYGTLGIGGTVVGTKDPSSSTSFTATYNIPASLVGASKIAIRFDSPQGYYAYDWFVNNAAAVSATATAGPTPTPGPTSVPVTIVIPTFSITGVQQGSSVSILTKNFPAGQTFTVRMGEYGSLGIGGTVIGTFDSGSGGALSQTYSIPAALAARTQIAIRMDSNLGYYSYNWFWNNANYGTGISTPVATATPGGATATPAPTITAATPVSGYVGIPTFSIASVVKDASVTISAVNFPPGQTFTVRMGEYGSLGVGGTVITTYDSGAGGSFSATYPIPAALAGLTKIAIRLESATGYYYSYNWFWNN